MIEGEEIFESAQETGFRLCRTFIENKSEQELVFSATWDLNIPNRLLVCLQNGQLKTFDIEDKQCDRFQIIFRRYTAVYDSDSSDEKVVTHHWDKMTTIPDRPDEIIFLLGISNTLMYTALPPPENNPYPEAPLLASTARGDLPGFIFGSPVMEICSHHSRVTALAISPAGHILASGDESGNVRLVLLRLLDEISVFKRNERRRKKYSGATSFSKFLPSYNVMRLAHNGPIFSLQWLPILSSNDSNNVRNYALATGSADRSVHVWRISCSTTTGITMTPAMTLDTLSTHVMSLNSYLYTDNFVLAKIHRLDSLSVASTPTKMSSPAGRFAFNSELLLGEPELTNPNSAKSIFLAAGTSVGMVYVWKLDFMGIMSLLSGEERESEKGAVVDYGRSLFSLLQASERPIIHVTLTSFPFMGLPISPIHSPNRSGLGLGMSPGLNLNNLASASGGDIVLAASDTVHTVHIFTPEKITLPNGAVTTSPKTNEADRTSLVRVGERIFSSPVVSCCFPPAYPSENENEAASGAASPTTRSVAGTIMAKVDRWDPTSMVQSSGPLLVSSMQGEVILHSTDDLAALSHDRQRALSGDITLSDPPRRRNSSMVEGEGSVDSVDSEIEATDRHLSRHNSMKKQNSFKGQAAGTEQGTDDDSDGCDEEEEVEEWEKLTAKRKTVRLPPAPTVPPKHPNKVKVKRFQNVDESNEFPRSGPPPLPMGSTGTGTGTADTSVSDASRFINGLERVNIPTARAQLSPRSEESPSTARSGDTDADTFATSTPSSPSLPPLPKALQDRIDQQRRGLTGSSTAKVNVKENLYTKPTQTYSKILGAQVEDLAGMIERDEISVSTIQTTQSDKLTAARAAQQSVARRMRYGRLTPSQGLDAVDVDALMADGRLGGIKKKVSKQVDPNWLMQRKFGGPTEEDLHSLSIPDPLVSVHLHYPNNTRDRKEGKARHEYVYNSIFGLRESADDSVLQHKYRMDVNMDQVFGKFSPVAAVELGESGRREFEREQMLGLVSNYTLL